MFNIFGDELDDIYYVNVIVSDSRTCRSHKEKTFCPFPPTFPGTFKSGNLLTEVKSLPFKPADDVLGRGKRLYNLAQDFVQFVSYVQLPKI